MKIAASHSDIKAEDLSADFTFHPLITGPVCVPFQLDGKHTVIQPFRRIEFIVRTAISVLPDNHSHLSEVKHVRIKCLSQATTSKQCPNIERVKT